jgi:Tfp pilus assembly protein PilN
MRAINLLPESDRAPEPARPVAGSGRAVLGILVVLLLATVAYVLTTNQISSRTDEIAKARSDIDAAQARVGALGPFQAFSQIKETRLASVQELADARFDWERLMRELALVLPEGSSLRAVTASTAGTTDEAAPAAATGAPAGTPSAQLTGCATSQREVAVMMVRLRQMHRALDVTLTDSTGPSAATASTGGTAPATTDGAGAVGTDCAADAYSFDATVSFGPEPVSDEDGGSTDPTPARLGGGS